MMLHKDRLFHNVRSFVFIAALLATAGCHGSQREEPTALAATPTPTETPVEPRRQEAAAPKNDPSEEDKTVLAVSNAIRKNHLTDRQDECLAFQFNPNPKKDFFLVDVRENHHYAKCGGDPNTSPRLFSVMVDKKSGKMSTDQGSTDGAFHPLPN